MSPNQLLVVHTSSGNHTPGCVLPSRIARTNADVAVPTDLKDMNFTFVMCNMELLVCTFLKYIHNISILDKAWKILEAIEI